MSDIGSPKTPRNLLIGFGLLMVVTIVISRFLNMKKEDSNAEN